MATKEELRRDLKAARLSMSEAEHTLASRQISEKLREAADWPKVGAVHYFEPIHELFEVDISPFVVFLEDNYPKLRLYTSRKIGDEWDIISVKKEAPAPEQFDVIIVPCLGFDKRLHRIGYGGGYYDKFLATQPKAQKIGVCFEGGRVERIPDETHDIALDLVVTATSVYKK